jgi:hypothetical protein
MSSSNSRRKQWKRLMVIARRMLRYDLEDKKRTFFTFGTPTRLTSPQRGKTPAHLLAVVQMMRAVPSPLHNGAPFARTERACR